MVTEPVTPPVLADDERPRLERIVYPENPRYRRIRVMSVLMDESIVLPTGYRIGVDPLLGLVPVVGDLLGALVSCYLVYESARLGVRKRVLLLMLVNVVIDFAVGSIPILGDVFDAGWKSNMRNLRLLDRYYSPGHPERPQWRIFGWIAAIFAFLVLIVGAVFYLTAKLILLAITAVASALGW